MEALGLLIFEIVKISILSGIYSALILLFLIVVTSYMINNLSKWLNKYKIPLWCSIGVIISVRLFMYMFSYNGDHGLGDSAIIPIGNYKVVNQIDGVSTYIQNKTGNQVDIQNFTFDKNNLYGKVKKEINDTTMGDFIVWNLNTDRWKYFNSNVEYLNAAKINGYPQLNKFNDFDYYYGNYWRGWRFWLLP